MLDVIRNPNNIMRKPNPVLALRENLGAPRHERNVQKRSMHMRNYGANVDMFRNHLDGGAGMWIGGDVVINHAPRHSFDFQRMLDGMAGMRRTEGEHRAMQEQDEHPYLVTAEKYGLNIPFMRHSYDDKGTMRDKVKYDKLPLFGSYLGIDVRDLAQMAFIVQQERSMSNDLKEIGWRSIGSGMYSNALVHRDNQDIVAKVCWSGDNCVLWLKYAMLNQGRAGIPVIHSIIRCGNGYICFMERMKASTNCEADDYMGSMPEYLFASAVFNGASKSYCFEQLKQQVHLGSGAVEYYTDLYQVVKTFMEWLPENSQRYDFHEGNALVSPTKGFVITDPIT